MTKENWALSKDWLRHGKHSGYENILRNMDSLEIISFSLILPVTNLFKKRTNLVNYSSIAFSKELHILLRFPFRKKIHVLYGDMDFYYLRLLKNHFLLKRLNNEIIVTFHHPPKELEKRLGYRRSKTLGAIDKIIVMGRNQIPFFKKYTSAEIEFIPHGVNMDFFKPNYSFTKDNQILVIGVSHRDHLLNREIIQKTNERNEKIIFKVVVPEKISGFYRRLDNVDLITRNISDEELLSLYQSSKGTLLMLEDCTASNTLLESLATGCPIIVNNVGAVRDYVPEKSGLPVFNSENTDLIVDYLISLCKEKDKFESISEKQIKLAAKYDWGIIAAATKRFINK